MRQFSSATTLAAAAMGWVLLALQPVYAAVGEKPAAAETPEPQPAAQPGQAPPLAAPAPTLLREGVVSDLTGRRQLARFHARLDDLARKRTSRVTILQIGDSHTAGDKFTGRLRRNFQEKYGNGGRGMLPAGIPYDGYRPDQVDVTQKGKWQVVSSNSKAFDTFESGISGFLLRSVTAGDSMTLAAREGAEFDSLRIGYYRSPRGGSFDVVVDNVVMGQITTRSETADYKVEALNLQSAASRLELRVRGDGPVEIADWGIYRNSPGVVLNSHGLVGAQIGVIDRWSWPIVSEQLKQMDPALIIVAFGTNEGFQPRSKLSAYRVQFDRRLRAIRTAAPNAAIVVVGPPDANRLPKYCLPDKPKVKLKAGAAPPKAAKSTPIEPGPKKEFVCRPLPATDAENYDQLLASSSPALCSWHTPPAIAFVRTTQREVARQRGVFFWDWLQAMDGGGTCAMDRWVKDGRATLDHVHMQREGFEASADALFQALMTGAK